MKTSDLDPRDYKYIVEKGDPGFNPAHNQWVVEQVIKETNDQNRKAENAWKEPFFERAKAAAAYLKSPKGAEAGNSVEKYFGKRVLAELVGEGIKNTIQAPINEELWQRATKVRPIKAKSLKG